VSKNQILHFKEAHFFYNANMKKTKQRTELKCIHVRLSIEKVAPKINDRKQGKYFQVGFAEKGYVGLEVK